METPCTSFWPTRASITQYYFFRWILAWSKPSSLSLRSTLLQFIHAGEAGNTNVVGKTLGRPDHTNRLKWCGSEVASVSDSAAGLRRYTASILKMSPASELLFCDVQWDVYAVLRFSHLRLQCRGPRLGPSGEARDHIFASIQNRRSLRKRTSRRSYLTRNVFFIMVHFEQRVLGNYGDARVARKNEPHEAWKASNAQASTALYRHAIITLLM